MRERQGSRYVACLPHVIFGFEGLFGSFLGFFLWVVLFVPVYSSGLRVLGFRVFLGIFGFLLVGSFVCFCKYFLCT